MKSRAFIATEKTVCNMFEKEYGLFTRNGTTAIWLALKALGFERKKIIIPANICFVVVCAIILSDNDPYFVDMDTNFSIDSQELEGIDSREVSAVIFPHMYGNTGAIGETMKIAKKKGWLVIEDVAQSLGARIGKRYAGSFADFSITSFGMGKIIDVNIGGILCLNSKTLYREALEIYERLPALNENMLLSHLHFNRIYSMLVEYMEHGDEGHRFGLPLAFTYRDANVSRLGLDISFLSRLEDKIRDLNKELDIRRNNAVSFQTILDHENVEAVRHKEEATYWRQNILVKKDRDGLLKYLKENRIKASKYFPSIDRLFYPRNGRDFKVSDSMAMQVINLWPGKETSHNDIININKLIGQYYKQGLNR